MSYRYDTPIRYVRGIGPTRSKELVNCGISTVGDLLEKQPLSYIFPGGVSIADAAEGQTVIKATITRIFRAGRGAIATLSDGTGTCKAQWFYNPWVLGSLRPGMVVTFWGKYKGGVLQQPKWSTCEASMIDVWGGVYGVHHDTIRVALKEVLAHVELPSMNRGLHRGTVFERFHFPVDQGQQQQALGLLKQDEALQLALALAERRRGRDGVAMKPMKRNVDVDTHIHTCFPFPFTTEQQHAIEEIGDDLASGKVMSRLLHGDVGVGKTAVAFFAAMSCATQGKRALILAPTTILVQQHYDTLKGMGWDDVALFATKDDWDAHIVVGTHAMLNNGYLMRKSSLVIIDEFQKFGVNDRAKAQKHNPHLLLMSATPIPRTLASTVFGDLDVSTIRQLPISRGQVITRWVLPDKREGMYEIIERELAKGKQAYFVYPRIGNEEQPESAVAGFTELCLTHFPDNEVRLLLGRYSVEDKAETLRAFKAKETDILVSTIIAEVGLDVPNATVMVIEGADRFGLSQLHQLRGRVCRSEDTVFCFLVSETANPTSIARLEVVEKINDGFEIAEHDLRLRGPGEVFSTRQHGLPDLKFVSLVDDYDLMAEARDLVQSGSVGDGVQEMTVLRYGDNLQLGSVT